MKIILLGPPGSGKGTQAEMLSRFYGIPHISTGEILRRAVSRRSPIAYRVKYFMNRGELVPDKTIFSIVMERLKKKDAKKGFVLDGFPRNLWQAEALEKVVGKEKAFTVFNLKVGTKTIIRRLSGRRVCSTCGANYHLEFHPPRFDERCNRCGTALHQRDDDKPAAIRNRLKVYRRESSPLLRYYRKRSILKTINGELEKEKIFLLLRRYLER